MRYSLLPAAIAFSAFFVVLPRTGAGTTVKIIGPSDAPRYQPSVTTVAVGARVAFENDTRATQTATCSSCGSKGWDSGDIQPGQTVFVDFRTAGSYTFTSRYDPQLTAQVLVGVEASPTPSASA
ncbi:MAG: cupredoxin domain-containing protein [Actinomycetota bacterium]